VSVLLIFVTSFVPVDLGCLILREDDILVVIG
jgi:hypothetical protein